MLNCVPEFGLTAVGEAVVNSKPALAIIVLLASVTGVLALLETTEVTIPECTSSKVDVGACTRVAFATSTVVEDWPIKIKENCWHTN